MSNFKNDDKSFTLVDLSKAIKDVLEIPGEDSKFIRFSKYHDLSRAVIATIKKALESGEEVHIKGFGKFIIYQRPKRRTRGPFHSKKFLPASGIVKFRPSKVLKRIVNEL